jgi:branched-chain amino acid transport system ATP-binding protein
LKEILKVENLSISFGSNEVLKGLSFELHENEVLGIIGPNGAGKTVLLNILSGILTPLSGRIYYRGEDITKKSIVERTQMGFGRTFQVPRSFENMTAYENALVGAAFGSNIAEKDALHISSEILDTIGLKGRKLDFARKLGLLDRKRLEIGIALASRPAILLLDEVAGGLTESELVDVLDIVRNVKEAGVSVIWIEHVLQTMLEGTDRVLLLAEGRDIVHGLPQEVMNSKEVEEIYLGID